MLVATLLDTSRPLRREEVFDRMAEHYSGRRRDQRRAFERRQGVLEASASRSTSSNGQAPGRPSRYRIRQDVYELPDPGLAPDELAAIHLAVAMVEPRLRTRRPRSSGSWPAAPRS